MSIVQGVVIVAAAAILSLPGMAESQPPASPAATIRRYAEKHQLSGTILVQRQGRILYHRSFGVADRAFNVPVDNDTKYRIASITKAFTSVLVQKLAEEGKLDLNATIRTYLPDYRGEGVDRVTIHQLLHHTSGIQNMDTAPSFQAAIANGVEVYQTPLTTDQLLARFASGKLVHEPGSTFDYNNADYVILGKIIEAITREPFEFVLRRMILTPLGMNHSGMLKQGDIVPRLAPTYFRRPDNQSIINDLPVYIENWYAAGAMFSTTSDLARFATALYHNRLLRPASLERMLTPELDDYGFGLWISSVELAGKRHRVAYRPGSIMGANTAFYRVLDGDLTVIILTNSNMTDLDELAPLVAGLFLR